MNEKKNFLFKLIATFKLSGAAAEMCRWIFDQGRGGGIIELDFLKFQKIGACCRRTVKRAMEKLLGLGILNLIKDYGASGGKHWVKLYLPEINHLFFSHSPCPLSGKFVQKNAQDPDLVKDGNLAAAISSAIDARSNMYQELCLKEGIEFSEDGIKNILGFEESELKAALALFKIRGGRAKIKNPQGWLISCLRQKWWQDAGIFLGNGHENCAHPTRTVIDFVINLIHKEGGNESDLPQTNQFTIDSGNQPNPLVKLENLEALHSLDLDFKNLYCAEF